jgi:tetratricopeptide (TPR) repeat protein
LPKKGASCTCWISRRLELCLLIGRKHGSCVGLGTLYLALGEMLGWQVRALTVPGHFFVRVQGANVELLHRGEEMPDAWYQTRFPIPSGSAQEYARPLLSSEVVAIVEYDIGNRRHKEGRLLEARRAYEQATRHFPDLAEAHASLGAVWHLLGDLDAADSAYRAARRANANLPGLDHNVDLLEAERRGTFCSTTPLLILPTLSRTGAAARSRSA